MKRYITATLVLLTLAACAGQHHARLLDIQLRNYGAAVRWNDFVSAMAHVRPEDRPSSAEANLMMARYENIDVTAYHVLSGEMSADQKHYSQIARIEFANKHTGITRVIQDRQRWEMDEDAAGGTRWWLVSGLPDITQR